MPGLRRAPRLAVAVGTTATLAALAVSVPGVAKGEESRCPALYVVGVQGAGEGTLSGSSTIDSGVLSEVMRPLVTAQPDARVEREYVGYDSGDTTALADDEAQRQYRRSLDTSLATVRQKAVEFVTRCRTGQLAVVGYRQGAAVAAEFAQEVGRGGDVPADRVAGIALLADPSRPPGAPLFPGTGQAVPGPAPGTRGEAVGSVPPLAQRPAPGGGIAAAPGAVADFGALTGRVASLCTAGDLACDTQNAAPIQQVVSNITTAAADAHGDPLRALASVGQALAFTTIKTATAVVNDDVGGNSLASLSYSPDKSLSQRLAEASNPQTPLDLGAVFRAVVKVGTIAFNSVLTVVRHVVTPANVAQIAAAGLADPAAGLLVLGQKLLGALPELVPPTTAVRLVSQAFDAVADNITDNTQRVNTATAVRYSDELGRRGTYSTDPVSTGGGAAAGFVSDWFAAAAADIAAAVPASTPSTPTRVPTSTPATSSAAATSTSAGIPTR